MVNKEFNQISEFIVTGLRQGLYSDDFSQKFRTWLKLTNRVNKSIGRNLLLNPRLDYAETLLFSKFFIELFEVEESQIIGSLKNSGIELSQLEAEEEKVYNFFKQEFEIFLEMLIRIWDDIQNTEQLYQFDFTITELNDFLELLSNEDRIQFLKRLYLSKKSANANKELINEIERRYNHLATIYEKELLNGGKTVNHEAIKSNNEPIKEILNTNEVMDLLGITRQTLDNYVNRGIVERKKLGSKNFYSFSNIQSAIDKGKIHKKWYKF